MVAKLMEMAPAMSPGTEASKSPTLLGTVAGQVMGTAGYMAPEHVSPARTEPLDRWLGRPTRRASVPVPR